MKPSVKQRLATRQKIAVAPALIRSLSLLGMSSVDLAIEIEKECQENPVLVVKPAKGLPLSAMPPPEATAPDNLRANLLHQLAMQPLDDDVRLVATYLTGDLTDAGYLSSTDDDIANDLSVPVSVVHQAIKALQSCEPSGIAARSLAECLRIQLVDQSVPAATAAFVAEHLTLFAQQSWQKLSRLSKLSKPELQSLSERLLTLNPHPAEDFAAPTQVIQPDLIIRHDGNGLSVEPSGHAVPQLLIDETLLAEVHHDAEARQYLMEYKQRAMSLIRTVHYREESLISICRVIMLVQHRFFAGDHDHLEPLTRKEIADACGLSAATTGRLIAHKYLQFDGRSYPLSHFVTSKVGNAESGFISSFSAQRRIAQFIKSENPETPLSDNQIADNLCREGVDITRRTVAKYRGCMNIPSSFRRRQIHKAKKARSR